MIQQSVSLEYEPSTEPLHISAKQVFLNSRNKVHIIITLVIDSRMLDLSSYMHAG